MLYDGLSLCWGVCAHAPTPVVACYRCLRALAAVPWFYAAVRGILVRPWPDGFVELSDLKRALFAMAATAQGDGPLCKPKRAAGTGARAASAGMSSSARAVAALPDYEAGSWASSSEEDGEREGEGAPDAESGPIRPQDLSNQASLLRLDLSSAKAAAQEEVDDLIGVTTGTQHACTTRHAACRCRVVVVAQGHGGRLLSVVRVTHSCRSTVFVGVSSARRHARRKANRRQAARRSTRLCHEAHDGTRSAATALA